jgi:hypothetical protein
MVHHIKAIGIVLAWQEMEFELAEFPSKTTHATLEVVDKCVRSKIGQFKPTGEGAVDHSIATRVVMAA